jgi:AraC-like DNA-binding protein
MTGPTISVVVLRHIVHCLDLAGYPPEPLLAECDIRRDSLDDTHAIMPLADYLAFLEAAAERAGNPCLGLHAGRLGGADSLGALGFLFFSAPTLLAALTAFDTYLGAIQEAVRHRFTVSAGIATFEYALTDQALQNRRQDAEFSLALMYTLCRSFVGPEFELVEVRFEHSRQGNARLHRDLFRCEVYFDQETNSFSFEESFLSRTGGAIDPGLFPIIEDHLKRSAGDSLRRHGLVREVRRLLECSAIDQAVTLESVAMTLGVSVATLNRVLRADGLRWRDLVHERRMTAAARLLRQSQRDIADIALAVGFAESASFVRSFARHYGHTPKRYRDASLD